MLERIDYREQTADADGSCSAIDSGMRQASDETAEITNRRRRGVCCIDAARRRWVQTEGTMELVVVGVARAITDGDDA